MLKERSRFICAALWMLTLSALRAQAGNGPEGGLVTEEVEGSPVLIYEGGGPYPPEDYWYYLPPGIAVEPVWRSTRDRTVVPRAGSADYGQQVVELVNQERWDWSNGQLPPLKRNDLLDTSAGTHSSNMATRDFFDHCDFDTGTLPWDRMEDAGYAWSTAGENIAAGYADPTAVMTEWMNSPGHTANILSTNYREIGVGYVYEASDQANVRMDASAVADCAPDTFGNGPYARYWTQNFGRRASVYPVVINRETYETDSRDVDLYVYGLGFAVDMRFRNEESAWSDWENYSPDKPWTLSPGDGVKEVHAEIRNGLGTVLSASDTILLATACSALDDDLDLLGPTTLTGYEWFEACNAIYAGEGGFYIAAPNGDVTFRAPNVVLSPGFSVAETAQFHVISEVPQ